MSDGCGGREVKRRRRFAWMGDTAHAMTDEEMDRMAEIGAELVLKVRYALRNLLMPLVGHLLILWRLAFLPTATAHSLAAVGESQPQIWANLRSAADLKQRFLAGEFAIVPPYPAGYVQVECPAPWELGRIVLVTAGLLAALRGLRVVFRASIAPPVGRFAGCWLHGKAWRDGAHALSVDWQRFADVCFFALLHAASTAFVGLWLLDELSARLVDVREMWWAFQQPPLTHALRT